MKLKSYLRTSNMMMFSPEGRIKQYTINDVINDFCKTRLDVYEKRKIAIISALETLLKQNRNRLRFITDILNGIITLSNKNEDTLVEYLEENKYDKENDSFRVSIGYFCKEYDGE